MSNTAKAAAAEFLQAALAGGPVPATEVARMAHEHGLTAKAVRMGREALAVEIARNGFGPGGRSLWALPAGMDAPLPGPCRGQPKTIDCYEVIGLAPDELCTYCGERGDDPVYATRALFKGVGREPLHEACAGYWFEFYSRINKRGGRGQT